MGLALAALAIMFFVNAMTFGNTTLAVVAGLTFVGLTMLSRKTKRSK